jgi:uncharacterized phage protein (TIGR02218 family)
MRDIDLSQLPNNENDIQTLHYCFEIITTKNPVLFLTSDRVEIKYQGITYLPFSGLSMREGVFNDSAQNYIYLHGIFEKGGIDNQFDMTFAEVKISVYTNNVLQQLVTMHCTEFIKNDLEFNIKLEPEVIKYNQSLLLPFSKTCRAKFGDKKCMIDKQTFSYKMQITEISGIFIIGNEIPHESDYFKGGEASIEHEDGNFYTGKILSHFLTQIELEAWFVNKLKVQQEITLTPGCDKKFITCCNKFNNELNFRGEPFVPEYKYLKN